MSGPKPRPGILDISPYVGGESKAEAERVVRLAANEGALGPSPKAMAAYRSLATELHRYPDGGSTALRAALGKHYGLDADRIVCGSGSDELISLLVKAYAGPGDEVLYSAHGFLMYALAAKGAGATPVAAPETDLRADVDACCPRSAIAPGWFSWPTPTTPPAAIWRWRNWSACMPACRTAFCWCWTPPMPNTWR